MLPATRALAAASALALVTGKKVAGLYDYAEERHLRIAAESRGDRLQGVDGDRSLRFWGTLPEIYDEGARVFISMRVDGSTVHGHDRGSANAYEARVSEGFVQLYDHGDNAWYSYDVQTA